MFHRSENLLLRPPWPEDWQAVHHAIAEEEVVRNLAGAPWPYGEDDARAYIAIEASPRYPRFLIMRAADAQLAGAIGLKPAGSNVEIGYWIARRFWGRGYATEAVRAVQPIARLCGHRSMIAGHYIDNPASGRVLEKAGFAPTGEVKPQYSAGRRDHAPCRLFSLDLDAAPLCMPACAA